MFPLALIPPCTLAPRRCPYVGVDLTPYPAVKAYFDGIAAHPAVVAAQARIAENPATTL